MRLGFAGCGFIARYHMMFLQGSGGDYEVGPVFDPDAERAASFASDYDGHVVGSAAEVIAGCDALYICTWTAAHRELAEAAAEAGRPVFCEKPLGRDVAEAEQVAAALEATPTHQVGLVLRHSPALRWLRHRARQDDMGRIMAVVLRDDQYLPVGRRYGSSWRADLDLAGAGALLEHSIHDVDLLEWIAGPIGSVAAHVGEFHGIAGIDDQAVCLFSHEGGAASTLTSIWHDIETRPSNRHLEVICEGGMVWLEEEWFGPVGYELRDGSAGSLEPDAVYAAAAEIDGGTGNPDGDFLVAVARGTASFPDAATALRAHRVVDAAYRSAASGSPRSPVSP